MLSRSKLLLALTAAALMLPSGTAAAAAAPVSEIVVDAQSGSALFAANATRSRPPASLAKLMTLLLTFEAVEAGKLRLSDKLVMTRRGARQPPSKLGLAAGRSISVRAALRSVAVVSANDVAVAMAERVSAARPALCGL